MYRHQLALVLVAALCACRSSQEHSDNGWKDIHIGGSGDQGVGVSVTHRRQRLHAARNDDHPVVAERAVATATSLAGR
jgi:hypothetical protein